MKLLVRALFWVALSCFPGLLPVLSLANLRDDPAIQAKVGNAIWKIIYEPTVQSGVDQRQAPSFVNGTLFFTSENGHFITNFHVLRSELRSLYSGSRALNSISETSLGTPSHKPVRIDLKNAILMNEFSGARQPIDFIEILVLPSQNYRIDPQSATLQEGLDDWVIGKVGLRPQAWLRASGKIPQRSDRVYLPLPKGNGELKGELSLQEGTLDRGKWFFEGHIYSHSRPFDILEVRGAPGYPGVSGSPLLDANGDVIGIATMTDGITSSHVTLDSALQVVSFGVTKSGMMDCSQLMVSSERRFLSNSSPH